MTKREVIIFVAGVEAFHTLSHLALSVSGQLPMRVVGFTQSEWVMLGAALLGHRQGVPTRRPAVVR